MTASKENARGERSSKLEKGAAAYLLTLPRDKRKAAAATINQLVKAQLSEDEVAEAEAETKAKGRRLSITWADEIEMANVEWLWDQRIPLGMITGLYGEEGVGKSHESIRIAAAISRGDLAGALKGTPRRVLIATTEDTWKHTVAPRLKAAGADMGMVGHMRVKDPKRDDDEGLELPRDAGALAEDASELDVGLVILDPVISHLEGKADAYKTKDVRKALEPLQRAAEQSEFGVLGIMHPNKGKGSNPRERAQASTAFREIFRSTLVFGPDPDRPDDHSARVLALDKNNLAPRQPSFRVRIEEVTLNEKDKKTGKRIKTTRTVLGEECAYTAQELLEASNGNNSGLSDEATEARRFLIQQLRDNGGAVPVKDARSAADPNGISKTALDKARRDLNLSTRRIEGKDSEWEWFDPEATGEALKVK